MGSKPNIIVLNGHSYEIWAQDMETLLKSKVFWKLKILWL